MSEGQPAHRTSQRKRGRKPLPTPDESELEAMSDTERALVERRLKNRSKAVLSRERRAVQVGVLQKKVSSLQATNKRLQHELDQAKAQLRTLHASSPAVQAGSHPAGLAELPGASTEYPAHVSLHPGQNSETDHLARSQSAGVLLPGQGTFNGIDFLEPGFTTEGEGAVHDAPPSAQSSGYGHQQPSTPHAGNHSMQQQQQQQKHLTTLIPDDIPLHHVPRQLHIYGGSGGRGGGGGENAANVEEEELFPLVFSPFASELPSSESLWNHHHQEHNGLYQETFADFRPGLGKGMSLHGMVGPNQSHSEEGGTARDQMDMYRMVSAPAALSFDLHQGLLG